MAMFDIDLYLQTGYSFNGSLLKIEETVDKAASMGFSCLGIADRDRMYGAVQFYRACKKANIKPVIGMETRLREHNDTSSTPVLLYAKDDNGYKNLMRLASRLGKEDKTELPRDVLTSFSRGIIVVIVPAEGPLFQAISDEDFDRAHNLVKSYHRLCEDVYLGIDLNTFTFEAKIAPQLHQFGKTLIVNRVAYLDKEDKPATSMLANILNKNTFAEGTLFAEDNVDLALKEPKQLDRVYSQYKEATKRTIELVKTIDVTLDFDTYHLPKFPVKNNISAKRYLRALCKKGLERRLRMHQAVDKQDYIDRLNHELSIIHEMGYDDYFLIVWDFVLHAKKNNILVGPGRGSAAGSLVAYVLGIVDVDPLRYDLFFERFLNPERITMPDIDMDFPDDKRDEVIAYVKERYGEEHVASIVTFGTFQGKSAIREVARMTDMRRTVVDEITAYVSETDNSITMFEKKRPRKYNKLLGVSGVRELLAMAKRLVGLPKHVSTHAAGIIISEDKITNHAPVQQGLLNMSQTQYEASDLEDLGLLKIDFLGIRNLTIIARVIDAIKKDRNKTIDIYKIPLDDSRTFRMLRAVKTKGIFQLESSGMMNLIGRMNIRDFEDISACIALYRPGPMENIPAYLRRRQGKEKVTYMHPVLKPILKSTEGIIVYQEQIMQIANEFAGYSLGEADVLRRAVSKKDESVLVAERKRFVRKSTENGRDEKTAHKLYDLIVKFANYGFNKSHSVVYALVAYWMAYLKANHAPYFLATLLDYTIGSQKSTLDYIRESHTFGIEIYPPDINHSAVNYKKEKDGLRFPFPAIRNIGPVVAKQIVDIRGDEPFSGFMDFMKRGGDINTRVIDSLIRAGCFDNEGYTKKTLINNLTQVRQYLELNENGDVNDFRFVTYPEFDVKELRRMERELLGFNLRYGIRHEYGELIKKNNWMTVDDLYETKKKDVSFIAMLTGVKTIQTKNGNDMAFLDLSDDFTIIDGVLFPDDYTRLKHHLDTNKTMFFHGKKEKRNDKWQIIINNIRSLKEES